MTDLPTSPVLVSIDLARVERNIARLHARAAAHGVQVRSHVKGHRTVEIARQQLRSGATGIAVTQLAQARVYVDAGVDDVVVAHPWPEPWRWRLIAELARDCRVIAATLAAARAVDVELWLSGTREWALTSTTADAEDIRDSLTRS